MVAPIFILLPHVTAIGNRVCIRQSRQCRLLTERRQIILCLGYAGWGPGQLDAEIEAGGWLYTDATSDLVFDAPTEEGYERALQSLGLTPETVWMQPISE